MRDAACDEPGSSAGWCSRLAVHPKKRGDEPFAACRVLKLPEPIAAAARLHPTRGQSRLQTGCKLGGNWQTAECHRRRPREVEVRADTCR